MSWDSVEKGDKLLNGEDEIFSNMLHAVRCCNDQYLMSLFKELPENKQFQLGKGEVTYSYLETHIYGNICTPDVQSKRIFWIKHVWLSGGLSSFWFQLTLKLSIFDGPFTECCWQWSFTRWIELCFWFSCRWSRIQKQKWSKRINSKVDWTWWKFLWWNLESKFKPCGIHAWPSR